MALSTRLLLALGLLSLVPSALAQHGGGGPLGGGGQQGGMGGGQQPGGPFGRQRNGFPSGSDPNNARPPGSLSENGGPSSTMHGGLQLGPPGRWWNDDAFAKGLGLDRDQQHRMDDIFKANKGQLVALFKGLQHEESQLGQVTRAKVLDEAQIDAQIDRVVQARGELEKANAHMLLEIRKQMTSEQTARLDEHRPPPPPDGN